MNRSAEIHLLAHALAQAQGSMTHAKKDSENPHFRSKYADLASIMEAIRYPLSSHGLSIAHAIVPAARENEVAVETVLLHTSGQWISSTVSIPVDKSNAHGYGSAITYARRYGLGLVGVVSDVDDDGNAAVAAAKPRANAEELMPESTKTAGITKAQLAGSRELIKQLKAKYGDEEGPNKARDILVKEFDAEHRTDLTEEQAAKWLARLNDLLEP